MLPVLTNKYAGSWDRSNIKVLFPKIHNELFLMDEVALQSHLFCGTLLSINPRTTRGNVVYVLLCEISLTDAMHESTSGKKTQSRSL
jgi:hypothetical protein